ncbi:MAG: hypothetical protein H7338_00540 [Candidatus Sericytochromatia bacterium]|nr:hypothetical protein [Candidatus Sericytochromatia bacterium]
MVGHHQNDLAKMRAVPSVRPMEESSDGDSQTSPGYDQGGAATGRKGFVERRRRPRRGPWTADVVTMPTEAQAHSRICLITEPQAPMATFNPVAVSMASVMAGRSGTRGRTRVGMLNLPMSGNIGSAKRA